MDVSPSPLINNFSSPKELEKHLLDKVIKNTCLIFAQNKFSIEQNQGLIADGMSMVKEMISFFSTMAFVEEREKEFADSIHRISQVVASHIMEMASLTKKSSLSDPKQVDSNPLESATDAELLGKKIKQRHERTIKELSAITSEFYDMSQFVGQSEIERKNQVLRSVKKIDAMALDRQVKKMVQERQASMNLMRKYLAIAETKGCTPDKVSDKDLAEFEKQQKLKKEKIRQQAEDEILAMDAKQKLVKKKVQSNKGKGAKKTAAKASSVTLEAISAKKTDSSPSIPKEASKTERPAQTAASSKKIQGIRYSQNAPKDPAAVTQASSKKEERGPETAKEKTLQARAIYIFKLSQLQMIETSRVIRWKTKNFAVIREFTDRNKDGKIVKKYAHLNDEDIFIQRSFHYLPGSEKVLGPMFREVYSFPTENGRGVYTSLFLNGAEMSGFIYFGEGKIDHKIYHKYFENKPYETKDFISLFKDRAEIDLEDTEEGEWNTEAAYLLEIDSKGILTVKFTKEDHYIKIYPLKKELLPQEILVDV